MPIIPVDTRNCEALETIYKKSARPKNRLFKISEECRCNKYIFHDAVSFTKPTNLIVVRIKKLGLL